MSETILHIDGKAVKTSFDVSYPEVRAFGSLNSCYTWKKFLHVNGLLSDEQLNDDTLQYDVIGTALFHAFQAGCLSVNMTKQTGIIGHCPVRMSTSLGGKMKGVWAFSTLSLINPFCLARMKNPELVCYHCYVKKSLHIMAVVKYVQNFFVLTGGTLKDEFIPAIRESCVKAHPIIRLESFGDLFATCQAVNYLAFARKNPVFSFGLWTKNPAILRGAIDMTDKPANLSTVLSMSRVNLYDDNKNDWMAYFDHTFIVSNDDTVTDDLLSGHGAYKCQCGPWSCIKCQRCYHKDDEESVNAVEKLRE